MITSFKKNYHKLSLLSFIIMMLLSGCVLYAKPTVNPATSSQTENPTDTTKINSSDQDVCSPYNIQTEGESTLVQSNCYRFAIPKEWVFESALGVFKQDGKEIGGLYIPSYFGNEDITSLTPNHSELVESKKLDGYFTELYRLKLKRDKPASENDPTITEQYHYYFLVKEQKVTYDLYFNVGDVDEKTALQVIKSFKLKDD
ncbi:MAG: hypothetical protein ACQEXQ_29795 [Bacillota bacterium]